jgi:hypothetical protein
MPQDELTYESRIQHRKQTQDNLLKYLECQAELYRTSRKLYMPPAERAEKVKFYTDSAEELRRILAKGTLHD